MPMWRFQESPVWKDCGTIVEDAHLYSAPYIADGVTGDDNLSDGFTTVWIQSVALHDWTKY